LLNSFIQAGLWDEARVFTGPVSLKEGIAAPKLNNEKHAFTSAVGNDRLEVFINKNSRFAYSEGMEL
jgi:diaminohydroxyphosphoribosylaminopyrimidine deaminase/5-amino-6-(5-phosphoribosylamino)uracil reductase